MRELKAAGLDVIGMDRVGQRGPDFVQVDFTDYGQVIDAFTSVGDRHDGIDAVVHLAAVPAPGVVSDVATFHNNMNATFNVLWAATRLGIKKIVTASSETVQGLPFDVPPPYIPVDEAYPPRPESVYSLVKVLEERLCQELVRWNPELSVTALRFSNVMWVEDYAEFPSFDADPLQRKWNLWSYIDGRDGAQAVQKALEFTEPGFDHFLIANSDNVMSQPNADLIAQVFPNTEVTREVEPHESLFDISKARNILGFEPKHSWRDHV